MSGSGRSGGGCGGGGVGGCCSFEVMLCWISCLHAVQRPLIRAISSFLLALDVLKTKAVVKERIRDEEDRPKRELLDKRKETQSEEI